MIKCGNCKGHHATVAAVKVCCGTKGAPRFTEEDEREMQRMEAEGDRAESRRDAAAKVAKWQREIDLNPATPAAINELRELLATKVAPDHERRYAVAVRKMLEAGNATGFAVRSAIARIEPWDNVRVGGGYASAGHVPDEGRWSSADRERAQAARSTDKPVEREGLYRLSRDVRTRQESFSKGTLVQVVRNKQATHLYAKTVTFLPPVDGKNVRPRLDYAEGLIFKLRDDELLPLEEAEEITRKTGWCVFGHFLTNPVSIRRGMGPKCYERYPHLARNAEEAA